MNLILLRPDELVPTGAGSHRAVLSDRRLVHLREVLRAGVGDSVGVGVEGGALGRASIVALDERAATVELILTDRPPPALDVTLALALPRPPTLRKVLQQATALGVKRFVLFRAERVEKSYFSSHGLHDHALAEDLRLGLEQARDTIVPTVEIRPEHFGRFVRERLPALTEGRTLLLAHPGAATPCPRSPIGPATLMIGPEGGFIPAEVAALAPLARTIDLGPRILRVETAVVALLSRLSP